MILENKGTLDIKDDRLLYFRDILYLSLPHNLNSTVSSVYSHLIIESVRGDSKEKIIEILERSREWKIYNSLLDLNTNILKSDQDMQSLFSMINEINSEIGIEFKITNPNQLSKYFKNIDEIFKKSAKKYKSKLLRVVDRVYEEKNKQFEYLTNDPGNVDYDQYTKTSKIDTRDYKLQNLLEYSDFIKEISKI